MATTHLTSIAAALVAMGLGTAATPTLAAPAEPFKVAQAAAFADEKLEAFVVALLEVEGIRQTYTPQVAEAEDDQTRAELLQSAQEEMVQAVQQTPGITVEEYNAISEAARADPELAGRLNEMVEAEAN